MKDIAYSFQFLLYQCVSNTNLFTHAPLAIRISIHICNRIDIKIYTFMYSENIQQ